MMVSALRWKFYLQLLIVSFLARVARHLIPWSHITDNETKAFVNNIYYENPNKEETWKITKYKKLISDQDRR